MKTQPIALPLLRMRARGNKIPIISCVHWNPYMGQHLCTRTLPTLTTQYADQHHNLLDIALEDTP